MQVTTDWVGLIDEWAYRFFAEMDYVAEAASAIQFQQEMARLEGIVVPDVFTALTSHFVLTTAWIDGARRPCCCAARPSSTTGECTGRRRLTAPCLHACPWMTTLMLTWLPGMVRLPLWCANRVVGGHVRHRACCGPLC